MIVAFEGIDGCGKSTQIKLVSDLLKKQDYEHITVNFPDRDSPTGKIIDNLLNKKKPQTLVEKYYASLLFTANRFEKQSFIHKKYMEKKIVLVDRYIHSGIAYSVANGLDLDWAVFSEKANHSPDIVIFLNMSASEACERKKNTKKECYENLQFMCIVEKVYQRILEKHGRTGLLSKSTSWFVVDATKNKDDLADQITSFIIKMYKKC